MFPCYSFFFVYLVCFALKVQSATKARCGNSCIFTAILEMVKISSQPPGIWSEIGHQVQSATNAWAPVQGLMWQQLHSLLSLHSHLASNDTSFRDSPWPKDQQPKDWFLKTKCFFVLLFHWGPHVFALSCVCLSRAVQTDPNQDRVGLVKGMLGYGGWFVWHQ